MVDWPQVLFGIEMPRLQDAMQNYWIVVAGLFALFFYGRHHFNTPNYALSGNMDASANNLIADHAISKINGLAPPIYTTTRSQYKRYMLRYVAILEASFIVITFFPELAKSIFYFADGAKPEASIHIPETVRERAIWALFILTGLLTSFPAFREIDGFILRALHKGANVPIGVEMTAQYLFEAKYNPIQPISDDIFTGIRTHHFREVIAGREYGMLETRWFELRCIREVIKGYILRSQVPLLQNILQSDIEEAGQRVDSMRDQIFRYSKQQDALLPSSVDNIDDYLTNRMDELEIQELLVQRRQFIAEVKALKLRFCRLCTLAVFAVEGKPESIDMSLKGLGFGVNVIDVPRWHWDSIFQVAFFVTSAVLVPSLLYGLLISNSNIDVPKEYAAYVPISPLQVFIWALMAAALHTLAVIVALMVKRFYARRGTERRGSEIPENMICAVSCYLICLSMQMLFVMYSGAQIGVAFAWATLPAATGYYVGKYIDKSKAGRPISNLRSIKQAGVMSSLALVASVITLINGFQILQVHPIVQLFTAYATIIGGSIGLLIGQSFQRTYSHSKWTEDFAVRSEIMEKLDARVIGDFIVQKSNNDDSLSANLRLSQGAGI